ncbi:MAG: hypothetical protein ACI4VH_07480 [Clostridia bacterium]
MFVGIGMSWLNFSMENCSYNYTEFDYTLNERNDSVINRNSLNKSFLELKNDITGECIELNKAINFKIEIDKNGFYYSNDDYNIYAYGETQREAENNILEEFKIQYESYALEKDEKLDNNAKILKNNLLMIYGGKNA